MYYIYIITNKPFGALYIGMTNNLVRRIYEHKEKLIDGFSKKYDLDKLVYYESYKTAKEAIIREKRMKKWNRDWKICKIIENNSEWDDLYETIV
ncbi:MAG: GIY-YIG nuclease family protein [Candidatus Margulisbacteria bacterium]|nr:GIY-YIG nuclease family protein [Candidatus Margulisiibacteriota bacterium]